MVRAAHVIKGAASNLMCGQLRETAHALESVSQAASITPNGMLNPDVLQPVQEKFANLKVAVQNYHTYLISVGV